jgi:hypothetical protein
MGANLKKAILHGTKWVMSPSLQPGVPTLPFLVIRIAENRVFGK